MSASLADLARILSQIDADEPLEKGIGDPILAQLIWGIAMVFASLEALQAQPQASPQHVHRRFHRIGEDLAHQFGQTAGSRGERLGVAFSRSVNELKEAIAEDSRGSLLAFLQRRFRKWPRLTTIIAEFWRQE